MRHVGDLPSQDQAQRFVDYLLVEGIKTRYEAEDGQFAIWAIEEDETDRVKEELAEFREDPEAEKYQGYGVRAEKKRKAEEKAAREFKKRQVDVRTKWRRGGTGLKAGPVTKAFIAISVVVALLTGLGNEINSVYLNLLFEKWIIIDGDMYTRRLGGILNGEIWRVVTPMFLHYGPLHLLFNMMWLYQLGKQMEPNLGTMKYLLVLLLLSALSNFGEYFWHQIQGDNVPFGGMSGVVYGMLGFIWMKSIHAPEERYYLPRQTVNFMLIWLVLCMTGLMGNIANAAHFVGLVAGCGFGYLPTLLKK